MSLREEIEHLHRRAEHMSFTQRMFRGELSRIEYANYLYQLQHIVISLEVRTALPHPSLSRLQKVVDDLDQLVDSFDEVKLLPMTVKYVTHLHNSSSTDLLPHVYVNYMGLMFGGQLMKSKVPGSGRIYDFDNMKEAIQSIRDIQHEGWAHEANIGLLFNIGILDELQKLSRQSSETV